MGKKDKTKKQDKKKQHETIPKKQQEMENKDVKEVLQLFSKLEEMVVDGDPRVRVALNQKPGLQNLLRDDSSLYGLSPRSQMIPNQAEVFSKEATNSSLLSFRNQPGLQTKGFQTSPRRYHAPIQTHVGVNRSPRRNIFVPPIAIPERSSLEEPFSQEQYSTYIKQHPDGTLVSTTLEPPRKEPQSNLRKQYANQLWAGQSQQVQHAITPLKPVKKERVPEHPKYHIFNYDIDGGQNSVRIEVPVHTLENPLGTHGIPSVTKVQAELEATSQSIEMQNPHELLNKDLNEISDTTLKSTKPSSLNYRTAVNKSKGTESFSKVIGQEGGSIKCFGCSVEVPKNALQSKSLFRVSILDAGQVPHKMERIYHYYTKQPGEVVMAISPAIRVDPADLIIDKPITVKLPTCIAVDGQTIETNEEGIITKSENSDIQTENIVIKQRNLTTNETWVDYETEIFRSADSVTFKVDKFGDVCAFHSNNGETVEALNKRISVFLFKSMDTRKNQFISLLVCEDLPHVIQKAIEGMPHWLRYSDSCFNVIMPEGRNLVIYIEATDRQLCSIDGNKIEVPWENLWHPECIIRKHIRVTLAKQEQPAEVQLVLDEGQVQLNTAFMWKAKHHQILLPDIMTSEDKHAVLGPHVFEQDMLKKVSWKPETPPPKFVTNKGLLNYATM